MEKRDVFSSKSQSSNSERERAVEIKKEEVLGFLRNIKVEKSPGSDGIDPRIVREAREEIAGAMREIFVSSLATGEVMMWRCRRWTGVNTVRVLTTPD